MRLIEKNEVQKGRKLIQQSFKYGSGSKRAYLGLALSYLPYSWRKLTIEQFRNARPKDYSELVRESK